MKRRDRRLSDELDIATLALMVDAIDGGDGDRVTTCDGCDAPVAKTPWVVARYGGDFCQLCRALGRADEIARRWRERYE